MDFSNYRSAPESPETDSPSDNLTTSASASTLCPQPFSQRQTEDIDRELEVPTSTPWNYSYDGFERGIPKGPFARLNNQGLSRLKVESDRKGKKPIRPLPDSSSRPPNLSAHDQPTLSSSSSGVTSIGTTPADDHEDETISLILMGMKHETRKPAVPAYFNNAEDVLNWEGKGKGKEVTEEGGFNVGIKRSIDFILHSPIRPSSDRHTFTAVNAAGPSRSSKIHKGATSTAVPSTQTPTDQPNSEINRTQTLASVSPRIPPQLLTPDDMLNLDKIVDLIPKAFGRMYITNREGNRGELKILVR